MKKFEKNSSPPNVQSWFSENWASMPNETEFDYSVDRDPSTDESWVTLQFSHSLNPPADKEVWIQIVPVVGWSFDEEDEARLVGARWFLRSPTPDLPPIRIRSREETAPRVIVPSKGFATIDYMGPLTSISRGADRLYLVAPAAEMPADLTLQIRAELLMLPD